MEKLVPVTHFSPDFDRPAMKKGLALSILTVEARGTAGTSRTRQRRREIRVWRRFGYEMVTHIQGIR